MIPCQWGTLDFATTQIGNADQMCMGLGILINECLYRIVEFEKKIRTSVIIFILKFLFSRELRPLWKQKGSTTLQGLTIYIMLRLNQLSPQGIWTFNSVNTKWPPWKTIEVIYSPKLINIPSFVIQPPFTSTNIAFTRFSGWTCFPEVTFEHRDKL